MLCHFLGIRSEADLTASPYTGAIWETLVAAELRRQIKNGRISGELFFWRDRSHEVDFLVHRGGRFALLEAKWTARPDRKDVAALQHVREDLPQRSVRTCKVVCRAAHEYPLGDGIDAVPVWQLVDAAE